MGLIKSGNKISLTEFTNTFVPFGLLLVVALWAAELTQNLVLYRAKYSIWVSMVLVTPAIALYVLPGKSQKKTNYWLLLWTFGFIAYLVHFYYVVFAGFQGNIRAIYADQGAIIATSNFVVTAWWAIDLIIAWFTRLDAEWVRFQRAGLQTLVVISTAIPAVILGQGFVRVLGIVMLIVIFVSVTIRIKRKRSHGSLRPADPAIHQT